MAFSIASTVLVVLWPKKKLNYYAFYQFKKGDDWRPNSHYDQHNAYVHLSSDITKKLKITGQYTLMKYLAQQPGGLTDVDFEKDAAQSIRARNWFKVDWNLISLNFDYKINENSRINFRNYTLQGARDAVGLLSYINRPDNGGKRDVMTDRYNNFGSELRFIHQYKLINGLQNTFLVGGRLYKGLTIRKQGDGTNGSDANFNFIDTEPNSSDFRFPGTNLAAFVENIFQINNHWTITPGIRAEHINTKANGYYYKKNIFIAPEKILETKESPRAFALLGYRVGLQDEMGRRILCKYFTELPLH